MYLLYEVRVHMPPVHARKISQLMTSVAADESVMVDMSKVNAIAFDPYTHGYYKVTERVSEAFRDGLKLKK